MQLHRLGLRVHAACKRSPYMCPYMCPCMCPHMCPYMRRQHLRSAFNFHALADAAFLLGRVVVHSFNLC